MLNRASPRPKPRKSSGAGALVVGGSGAGGREQAEQDRGHLVALVPVEGGTPLVDFQGLPDFPLLEAGLTGQHPHMFMSCSPFHVATEFPLSLYSRAE